MRLLLDTQVFLWLQTEPERLGSRIAMAEDRANELLFSAASSWEIAIKYARGKLPLPEPPAAYVPARVAAIGAVPLPVEHGQALAVASLPVLHRDPFDRLLVAQAQLLGLTVLTADETFAGYEVAHVLVGA